MKLAFELYVFWVLYLAIMSIYKAKLEGTITKTSLLLGYPILLMGYAMDAFFNITVFSVVFLQLPREILLTTRLKRYKLAGTGWRFKTADFICKNMLNAFDPTGKHC